MIGPRTTDATAIASTNSSTQQALYSDQKTLPVIQENRHSSESHRQQQSSKIRGLIRLDYHQKGGHMQGIKYCFYVISQEWYKKMQKLLERIKGRETTKSQWSTIQILSQVYQPISSR